MGYCPHFGEVMELENCYFCHSKSRNPNKNISENAYPNLPKDGYPNLLTNRNSQSKCLTCANVADACTPDDPDSPCGDEPERKADLRFREKTSNK